MPVDDLAVGASMTCTATGTAQAGQYENNASVVGPAGGQKVSDTDASHYFWIDTEVSLKKYTNGRDADTAPGPTGSAPVAVSCGSTSSTTRATSRCTSVTVTDDQGVTVRCRTVSALLPNHRTICVAPDRAKAGQYANIGTARRRILQVTR